MLSAGRLTHAIAIARQAHKDQTDKLGRPYLDHCQRVADVQTGEVGKTIAYLHDVVTKGEGWTLTRLLGEGFSSDVIAALDALIKRLGESDDGLMGRARANPHARSVKRADLADNLHQMQEKGGDTGTLERGLLRIDI
jgi:(p)ppGpp synthase/HD superfamily hydrolase